MATTTFAAIRDNYVTKIQALAPRTLASLVFDRVTVRQDVRAWASANPTSEAARKFEIRRSGGVSDPLVLEPSLVERQEAAELVVAYPLLEELYGRRPSGGKPGWDDLEDVMRDDAAQLRDLLTSPNNLLAGQTACVVTIEPPERLSVAAWFSVLSLQFDYYESQAI